MNTLIQILFKLAIKYIVPMPDWFIQIYLRTLSDEEIIALKLMCYKTRKNKNEDYDK